LTPVPLRRQNNSTRHPFVSLIGGGVFLLLLCCAAPGCDRDGAAPPLSTRAEGSAAEGEPVRVIQDGPYRFSMTLDPSPARAGVKSMVTLLALSASGGPLTDAGSARVTLTRKAGGGPIETTLTQTGPGTFIGAVTPPAAGDWQAQVTVTKGGETGTAMFKLGVADAAVPSAP